MGILDEIINTQQQESLQQLELALIVSKILESLKERERLILAKRYGLQGHSVATLKTVGEEQGLTRERVRQIEKELLKNLRKSAHDHKPFVNARDLLVGTVADHGGIMSEQSLMNFLGIEDPEEVNSLRFILNLVSDLEPYTDDEIKESWTNLGFNKLLLKDFIKESKKLFDAHGKPLHGAAFIEKFKDTEFYNQNAGTLNEKVLLNFLHAANHIQKNAFEEFGLQHWNDVRPKDVGDKAYLVMKHHGKPEHYSAITELINKHKLDKRTAYKETVHNKLIKDKRFVLVGRGIYALAEWGYKPGVVSDMIVEIMKEKGTPMTRDEIVESVLGKRLVKKNTILVGLSNKKLFKKVGKNQYALATA